MKQKDAHLFALFIDDNGYRLEQNSSVIGVVDPHLITRITSILRLKPTESLILFTHDIIYHCTLMSAHKKQIECKINNHAKINPLAPSLDIVVPILERDALEEVVYLATVHGVQNIHPVSTQKSRKVLTEKDYQRLRKIAIAAAEQSKQYRLPTIAPFYPLESFIEEHLAEYALSKKLWCDVAGEPLLKNKELVRSQNGYLVIWGPEGDFTLLEKEILQRFFIPVKLTNTVLRARDAACLIMGVLRL